MPTKLLIKNKIVEMDGDEMSRIVWGMIKEKLLDPFLDYQTDYFDLGLENRDATEDQVTHAAAAATLKHGVAVKCATITPDAKRVKEYGLKKQWKSPNGTIRATIDGTLFRSPIIVNNIQAAVRNWQHPIHIARHAFGDVYQNQEIRVQEAGKAELVYSSENGKESISKTIAQFKDCGILQGIFNTDTSIKTFATSCFQYALEHKSDLCFAAKDTISKVYDAKFKEIFEKEYNTQWKQQFEEASISYYYTLIDDAVARVLKSKKALVWACKNYDGDIMSDFVAAAYGSLAMMKSVLVSPQQCFLYEAAHGTVQKHFYQHQQGQRTSTNPTALIFAWAAALRKRSELDQTPAIASFADKLESACAITIESGLMTKDLIEIADTKPAKHELCTEDFLDAVQKELDKSLCD